MRNTRKLFLLIGILWTFSGNGLADTKIGIGTGATFITGGFGGTFSMPMKLDSRMLIEPYIGYSKNSDDTDVNQPDFNIYNRESYQVGIGVYGIKTLNTEFDFYYGAALSLGRSNSKRQNASTYGLTPSYNYNKFETDNSTYGIKPTLGISYLINDNFSFSLDAGIYYYWGDETEKRFNYSSSSLSSTYTEYTSDIDGFDTYTRFIFRMMF